jgi:hypothetical protein
MAARAHNTGMNPAVSAEQYRLAQAVLSGTARDARMPVSVAREIVDRTPAKLRSEYSRYTVNPAGFTGLLYSNRFSKADKKYPGRHTIIAHQSGFASRESAAEWAHKEAEIRNVPLNIGTMSERDMAQYGSMEAFAKHRGYKLNPFYGTDLDLETSMAPAWMYYDSKAARDAAARLYEGRGKKVVLGHSMFGFGEGGGKKWRLRGLDHRGNPLPQEILVYGIPKGETERYTEVLLSTQSKTAEDVEKIKAAASRDGFHSFRVTTYDGGPPDFTKVFKKGRKNPQPAADDMYASFHGEESDETIEIQGEEHYHAHVAALGELVELKVKLVSGARAVIGFETGSDDEVDNPFWSSAKSTASKISGSVLAGLKRASASRKERARWIPYATTENEMRAQAKAGYLEAHDVSAKVERRKIGGMFSRKYKFDVMVDREQLREMFKRSATEKKASRGTRAGGSKPAGAYKGFQIREVEGGFAVPKLDPTGVFSSKADAKEFIDYSKMGAKVKNPGPFREAGKLLGKGTRAASRPMNDFLGAAGKVGGYLDNQLGRVLNPPKDKTKLDLILDRVSAGKHEVTFDVRDGYTPAQIERIISTARARGLDASSDGKYVLVRDLRQRNPSGKDTGPAYLTSNEDGTQLFITGGDQSLDLPGLGITGPEANKELVTVGSVTHIVYHAHKIFDGKREEFDYIHKFSEDSHGPLPVLLYDRINQQLKLSGGMYKIERPLVGTSPGIED